MADVSDQPTELPAQDGSHPEVAGAEELKISQVMQKQSSSKAGALAAPTSSSRNSSSKSTGLPSQPGDRNSLAQSTTAARKSLAATAASSRQTSSKSSQPASASASSSGTLDKIRAARASAAAAAAAGNNKDNVASTISKAKEALAKARAGAAAGGLTSSHSCLKVAEGVGVISDKPFTLYGRAEPPKPKSLPQIKPADKEEDARRKAWQAEKQAMRERRLAQEAARKEREEAAKAAAAAARAEAHHKLVEERKAKYEAYKAREAEVLKKSEEAWKQYQNSRGRPPLFKIMEDEFRTKHEAEEEAKRAAYDAEVASAKLATVSQLVKGEVVIRPPAGSISPGRSRSPGGTLRSPLGSGELSRSQIMGRTSPHSTSPGRHSLNASWGGGKAGAGKFPASCAVAKQLVDRACSPLTPGQIPPGAKIVPTRLAHKSDVEGRQPVAQPAATKQPSQPGTRSSSMHKPAAAEALGATEPDTQPAQQMQHQESYNQEEHIQASEHQQEVDETQAAVNEDGDMQQDEDGEQQQQPEAQQEASLVEEEEEQQQYGGQQQAEDEHLRLEEQQDATAAEEVAAEDEEQQQQPEYEGDNTELQAQGSLGQEAEAVEETEAAEEELQEQGDYGEGAEGEQEGEEYAEGHEQQGAEVTEEPGLEGAEEAAAEQQ